MGPHLTHFASPSLSFFTRNMGTFLSIQLCSQGPGTATQCDGLKLGFSTWALLTFGGQIILGRWAGGGPGSCEIISSFPASTGYTRVPNRTSPPQS